MQTDRQNMAQHGAHSLWVVEQFGETRAFQKLLGDVGGSHTHVDTQTHKGKEWKSHKHRIRDIRTAFNTNYTNCVLSHFENMDTHVTFSAAHEIDL